MAKIKSRTSKQDRSTTVQSVERAVMVLDAMAQASGPCTALELSKVTGIHRTIVHRLLNTLMGQGLTVREGSNRYSLGPRALTLGYQYLDGLPVRRIALPYALELSREVIAERPWAVAIAVPVGDEVIIIERIWGPAVPLNSLLEIGTRLPIERSAAGRSILARYSPAEAQTILGPSRWRTVKPVLKEIGKDGGIAYAHGEFRPGISAIAAPIMDSRDRPLAALVVSGPALENELRADSDVADHVRRSAQEITQTIAQTLASA